MGKEEEEPTFEELFEKLEDEDWPVRIGGFNFRTESLIRLYTMVL